MFSSLALAIALTAPAHAGTCDPLVKKADTAQGQDLADAFKALVTCDKSLADDNFVKFMASAKDSDALVGLSLVAVDMDVWPPVWGMIAKITSYDARDEVAGRIGEACATHPKVVPFLEGAYFGLKDIDFAQWDAAFRSCDSPDLMTWMTTQVETPPNKPFDDKFNTVMTAFSKKQKAAALPSLTTGAIKAAKGGPFDAMLDQMDQAISPEGADVVKPEDQAALSADLQKIAKAVSPDKARAVADRLFNSGATDAAAKLLPNIFPDRVQAVGGFLYGGASIEAADCKGVKTVIIHYASVTEPGKLWNVLPTAEAPLRAAKPKLDKCKAESTDPWDTALTPEPVKDAKDILTWVDTLSAQWKDKGYAVTVKEEKAIAL